jgi:hypothetical protein
MSDLSRVFVILILFLAIFFFATSASLFITSQNWRTAYENYESKTTEGLASLKGNVSQMTSQLDNRDRELDKIKLSEETLAGQLDKARKDLGMADTQVTSARSDATAAQRVSDQLAENLKESKTREGDLLGSLTASQDARKEAQTVLETTNRERDQMKLSLVRSQELLHNSRTQYQELLAKHEIMMAGVENSIVRGGGSAGSAIVSDAPLIAAQVSAVDNEQQLAVISAGRDQQVEIGYEFTVARGESFVAKLQVISVYPDLSGARILFSKDGEQVQAGDRVMTSLD